MCGDKGTSKQVECLDQVRWRSLVTSVSSDSFQQRQKSIGEKEIKTMQWGNSDDRSRVNAQSRMGTEKKDTEGAEVRESNILRAVD